MSDPRAFISFDVDNNDGEKLYFAGQAKNSRTPFNIQDWSSKKALPQREWEELINTKISKCNMLIILVGKYMSTATGVDKEIEFARQNNVPVFGVYVGGATSSSTLPLGLSRNRTVEWNWEKIADMIDQMMKEGKNK